MMVLGLAASEATAQTYGTITLGSGFFPNPQSMTGTSGGLNDASSVYGGDCRGWIANSPDHQMFLTSSLSELTISVESTEDTTLVVIGPSGVFCNDDSNLFNPAITASFSPGTYNIFVGSYYAEAYAPYTISFSQLGEDPIPTPIVELDTSSYTSNFDGVTLATGFFPDPYTLSGASGGDIGASYLGETGTGPCRGYATATPDHVMTLNTGFDFLRISVSSVGDTTLIVHGPDGWWCNDDSDGVNPEIAGGWIPGYYRIWVGSYTADQFHPYSIEFSEFGSYQPDPTPVVPTTLDVSSTTTNFDSITLVSGFLPDPQTLLGTSGGEIHSGYLGETGTGPCRGYATSTPDHMMTLNSYFEYLSVSVQSSGDTTLVINGPDGWWCNDDSDGVNPAIAGGWIPGTYRIWVGSYGEGQYHAYSVAFSEYAAVSPTSGSYFQGSFEEMDVYFSGDDADAVYQDCDNFLTMSGGASYVDDITIFGTAHHNGPSYWGQQELCSIVALNVQPQSGSFTALLEGQIEDGVPFSVGGTIEDVRNRLATYIPMVAGSYVDDLNINGVVHHNGPSYWNAEAIVAILSYNIEQPGMPVVARGNVEETPFAFAGWTRDDIQTQCIDFVDTIGTSYLDDVVVNGTARHNGPSYWSSAEVCMIVSSLASE